MDEKDKHIDRRKVRKEMNRVKNTAKRFRKKVLARVAELQKEGFTEQIDQEIEDCKDLAAYAHDAYKFSKQEVEAL